MQLLKFSLKKNKKRKKLNFWENTACEIKSQTFKSAWRFEGSVNDSVRV